MAENLCSVIYDHLIKFVITPSYSMYNLKETITKKCYKNFDSEKFRSDFDKVNWQKFCYNPDPNVLENIF